MRVFDLAPSRFNAATRLSHLLLWVLALSFSFCALSAQALSLTGVQSRKTHLLGAGIFDVAVDTTQSMSGAVTVESRTIGAGHTLVFQFDGAISSPGNLTVVDDNIVAVTGATAAASGNDVVVTLTGIADNKRVTITLTNVNGIGLDVSASLGFLVGDVNGTRSINSSDITAVKARSGLATDASNFRFDVNASGAINSSDISSVKARSGQLLPAGNAAPVVSAGANQTITLPSVATLAGTATDDGLPNPPAALTLSWSQVSGPGTITFGDASIASTTASFSAAGVYVLRLTANDSQRSSSADVTVTVNKTGQSISFTSIAPAGATVGGATYSVAATATSGLAVSFAIDAAASTVCTIAGSIVSFVGPGTCVINANQTGDATFSAAPQLQQSFAVVSGAQTISFTSVAPAPAVVGGPTYTVTATATSGLPVAFTIDAAASAVCSIAGAAVSFTAAGTCVINANQPGNASFGAAPQVQQSFVVVKSNQTISFTSTAPAGATSGGLTYTVTATATSGLAVAFSIDASASAVCTIAGATVSFIGGGTCVINANQAGNASFNAAPQLQQSFTVAKATQTINFTSSAPAGATAGGATYAVSATATSGLVVAFSIDASASTVCSIAGSTVTFIGAGTCVINANQGGNASFNPATQLQQSFAVVKGPQSISFTSSAPTGATIGGATYTASASATSGLAVALTIDATASTVCTIAGATVSFIGAGTCIINANQSGNAAFNAAPQVQQSFAVNKANQSISFTSTAPTSATVGGPTYAASATATSGLSVAFTIDATASAVCAIAGATVSFIGSGTCVINGNQAGNASFNPAPQVQQSFAVVKANQTITFTSVAPAAAAVGGATYTVTATATSGLVVAFGIDASASAVCSITGATVSFLASGSCVINANQAGNANFNAAPQVQQAFTVTAPPVATNDTYPETIIGNVKVDSSLIAFSVTANDTSAQTITAFDATTASGGTVTMTTSGVGIGQFTYDPPPGFTGADTFNYTIANVAGSRTAQVTINISASAKPWFVDANQATNGDGRLTRPFNNLASLQAINDGVGTHPKANDTLFLYESTVNYTGPITLQSGQKLIGQDSVTGFDAASAITFTASALARPVMNSGNGTRAIIASAGVGVSIGAAGNTVRGLSIGNSTDAISASAFGTLTVADVSINTNGRALNLANGALATTFDSITASGGVNGVILQNTSGTANLGTGALSGASGAAFAVSGGTATISYAGTISQSSAARVVDIQSKTGGAVTLSGAIASTSGTGTGINLNANTGATINFSGGIALTTNANNAFSASGGGTINVTQNNTTIVNTLTTTTGIALNIANTTIGASGIAFRSISSNGASNGIVVNNTGSSGGLTITGNGGSCTSAATCTGGAIQNSTGDGVVLTSTFSPRLTRLNVTDAAGTAADDGIVMTNVTGSVNIDSCAILNSPHNGITVDNFNTNMAGFNFTNNIVSCAAGQPCQPSGSIGNDGLLLQMRGTSVLASGLISGSTFSGHRAVGVQIQANDSASIGSNAGGAIVNSVTVQNNTLTGNGQGIDIDSSQVSNLTFQVLTNTINGRVTAPGATPSDASSNAINAFTAAGADTGPASHSFVGKIDGNVIGTQGVKDSGSGFGSGIRVVVQGGGTQGNVVVNNNTIRETANADVMTFIGQNGAGVAGTGTAKFKITNNSMPAPSGSNLSLCGPANTACASNGIFVLADEGNPVCSVITGNNVFDVVPFNGTADLYLAERTGPPPGALLRVEGSSGGNSAFLQANNTLAGGSKYIDEGSNTVQVAPGSCGTFP